jgi:hypothetical protein
MKTAKKTDKTQAALPDNTPDVSPENDATVANETVGTSDQPTTLSPADPTVGPLNVVDTSKPPRTPSIGWSDERLVTLFTTIEQLKADNDGVSPTAEQVAIALQENDQFSDVAALLSAVKIASQLRALRKRFPNKRVPVLTRKAGDGRAGARKRDLSALEALLPDLDIGETQDAGDEEDAA